MKKNIFILKIYDTISYFTLNFWSCCLLSRCLWSIWLEDCNLSRLPTRPSRQMWASALVVLLADFCRLASLVCDSSQWTARLKWYCSLRRWFRVLTIAWNWSRAICRSDCAHVCRSRWATCPVLCSRRSRHSKRSAATLAVRFAAWRALRIRKACRLEKESRSRKKEQNYQSTNNNHKKNCINLSSMLRRRKPFFWCAGSLCLHNRVYPVLTGSTNVFFNWKTLINWMNWIEFSEIYINSH